MVEKDILLKAIHDLKTPLTSISCVVDLLEGSIKEDKRGYIPKIKAATEQLLDQITVLHWLVRIETGDYESSPQRFRLKELIESTITSLCSKGFPADNLKLDISDDIIINTDPFLLRQTIECLLKEFRLEELKKGIYIGSTRGSGDTVMISISNHEGMVKRDMDCEAVKGAKGCSISLILSERLVGLLGGELHMGAGEERRCYLFTITDS